MEVGHTTNKRVRLLINDHGPDGYWVWKCLIDVAYGTYGYYFPCTQDDIELIAVDVCRKPPEFIWLVVESCVKRGLFDRPVYEKCHILTNDKMQFNFLRGTFDRRRKGTTVVLQEKHFLLDVSHLNGLGDKYLDKVVFSDSGNNLKKMVSDTGNTLFSTGKTNDSTGKSPQTPENPEIPLQDRDRDRDRDINTILSSDDDGDEKIGVKEKNGEGVAGLAKKSQGKKKVAQKKKGRNPDSEPYWHAEIRVWVDFNLKHLHFDPRPIPKSDYSSLHRIVENIRTRATDQGTLWTEPEALTRLDKFFEAAYTGDKWLRDNFELKAIESKKQTIFKLSENGHSAAHVVGKTIKFDKL